MFLFSLFEGVLGVEVEGDRAKAFYYYRNLVFMFCNRCVIKMCFLF